MKMSGERSADTRLVGLRMCPSCEGLTLALWRGAIPDFSGVCVARFRCPRVFDSISKLETFLSTGGNKILIDRLVKVPGVLVHEDGDVQDVYAAIVGAGRYIRHFLGIRKSGPNVAFIADPQRGPSDSFLRLEVRTRNNVGVAARSILVANFGMEWDESALKQEFSETPAKRFKGMLDKYFVETASSSASAPPGDLLTAGPPGGLSPGAPSGGLSPDAPKNENVEPEGPKGDREEEPSEKDKPKPGKPAKDQGEING